MFEVKINGKIKKVEKETRVIDLFDNSDKKIIAVKINNKMRELTTKVNKDCEIDLFDLKFEECAKIYEASLRFLFAMAAKKVYPCLKIRYSYNVSRSILIKDAKGKKITKRMLKNIKNKMLEIIDKDYDIVRYKISNKEAEKIYEGYNMDDKVAMLQYRPEARAHIYKCDRYQNYVHSYMVPSTGYLDKFKLFISDGNVYMQFPRADENGEIPKFKKEKKYAKTLAKSYDWAKIVNAQNIPSINKNVEEDNIVEFVNMCETRHNDMLCELGVKIASNKKIKIIAIAGPSSSGKTTFADRLAIELAARNIKTKRISMDDYYIDRDKILPDENGKLDLEDINTLNVKLFNEQLAELIEGKEIQMPRFDFHTGKSVKGEVVRVKNGEVIIIEGIHALNDRLTASIPKKNKFLIYIAPHIQVNIDNHTPMSITQFRLLRRLVRDKKFRNATATRTLSMWESVRKGEFKWIYDNQEKADYVFNSELSYEICVLKKYALPILREVEETHELHYLSARLQKFLKYFQDIDDSYVPVNSLLREFIGGSCFRDV